MGWSEIVLSVLSLITLYFYKERPTAVALTVGVLAVLAYFVDGGFFYIGATLVLIGAIVIYFRK